MINSPRKKNGTFPVKLEPEARSQHFDTGVGVGRCGKKLLERGITLLQIFKHPMAMISEVQKASCRTLCITRSRFYFNTCIYIQMVGAQKKQPKEYPPN